MRLTTTAQWYLYGMYYGPYFYATETGTNYYFGSKLIKNAGGWVYSDRLGSVGKFYPYGQERPSPTTNGTEKFTGYFRDAETGNDYAINRYQQPGTGRFLTAGPCYLASSGGAGDPGEPGSFNRYAYSAGDPVNFYDPRGLLIECPDGTEYRMATMCVVYARGGTLTGPRPAQLTRSQAANSNARRWRCSR